MHTDPFDMTNYELREEHNALHFGRVPPDKKRHDEIAKEMIRRGMHHNTEWSGAEDMNESIDSM